MINTEAITPEMAGIAITWLAGILLICVIGFFVIRGQNHKSDRLKRDSMTTLILWSLTWPFSLSLVIGAAFFVLPFVAISALPSYFLFKDKPE